jgi:hypothetical protein
MVFGTFAEMSSSVKDFVEMAVEYGVEHLVTCMAASTPDVLRVALRRRYMAQLSMAVWRGYTSLVLDMTKYVGTVRTSSNRAHTRMDVLERSYAGEHADPWAAHDTNMPPRDAFPIGWGDN